MEVSFLLFCVADARVMSANSMSSAQELANSLYAATRLGIRD